LYYNLQIKREVLEDYLKTIKSITGIPDDLEEALKYAAMFAMGEEKEIVVFLNKILQELASGRIRLDFDIFELYRIVQP